MTKKLEELEQKILFGVTDCLDEAHEHNAMPCPCCCAKDFVDGQLTAILQDIYEAGKDGNHRQLLDKLYSNQVTFATLAFTYENLMEKWQELFEEEYQSDVKETIEG